LIDLRAVSVVTMGAGVGGALRFLVTQFFVGRFGAGDAFYATLFINISGSFAIGLLLEIAQTRANFDPLWRSFFSTGLLGGYTTFSTFSYEALNLLSETLTMTAIFYVVASVALGIIGCLAGISAARSLGH
jgi:CrcB protein